MTSARRVLSLPFTLFLLHPASVPTDQPGFTRIVVPRETLADGVV